jgi:hypothetical protein
MLHRRAVLLAAVPILAAGHALRALVAVIQGEPDAGPEPDADLDQAEDPVLVPVRDIADPPPANTGKAKHAPASRP